VKNIKLRIFSGERAVEKSCKRRYLRQKLMCLGMDKEQRESVGNREKKIEFLSLSEYSIRE
jgi:hypothetical protein